MPLPLRFIPFPYSLSSCTAYPLFLSFSHTSTRYLSLPYTGACLPLPLPFFLVPFPRPVFHLSCSVAYFLYSLFFTPVSTLFPLSYYSPVCVFPSFPSRISDLVLFTLCLSLFRLLFHLYLPFLHIYVYSFPLNFTPVCLFASLPCRIPAVSLFTLSFFLSLPSHLLISYTVACLPLVFFHYLSFPLSSLA